MSATQATGAGPMTSCAGAASRGYANPAIGDWRRLILERDPMCGSCHEREATIADQRHAA